MKDRQYLAESVGSGWATDEEWKEYWTIFAKESASEQQQQVIEPRADAEANKKSVGTNTATYGIGIGSALAMILSFESNHSIIWAMLHGVCSWVYVIYRAYQGNY